jgi:hypothetical protein
MADHDPLCPSGSDMAEVCGICALIARAKAAVAEEIAQAIEAEREQFMRVTSADEHHWLSRVFTECAAIARRIGGAP